MRIPVNLASRPPENFRLLSAGLAVLGLAALLLGGVILHRELRSRSESRSLIDRQDQLEASLKNLQGQQAELESALSTPQAMQIRARSAFLNSLILRKGLSWTQIFMDLEQTLPAKAHIVAIHPSLNASENVGLTLTVASSSIGPLVEFVKNLESSPQFGSPVVGGQHYGSGSSSSSDKTSGEISMDLTTAYRQERAAAPEPAPESPAKASQSASPTAQPIAHDLAQRMVPRAGQSGSKFGGRSAAGPGSGKPRAGEEAAR